MYVFIYVYLVREREREIEGERKYGNISLEEDVWVSKPNSQSKLVSVPCSHS